MKQYEYDVITNSKYLNSEFLSGRGKQGWDLVSHTFMSDVTVPHVYTFKREKIAYPKGIAERKFKLDDSFKKALEEIVVSDTPAYSWMDEYRREYDAALTSGMFFEWFPTFTGVWDRDKYAFCHDRKYKKLSPQDTPAIDTILEIEETDEERAYRKGYMDGYDEGLYDGQYK